MGFIDVSIVLFSLQTAGVRDLTVCGNREIPLKELKLVVDSYNGQPNLVLYITSQSDHSIGIEIVDTITGGIVNNDLVNELRRNWK